MNVLDVQQMIDKTEYWDMPISFFQVSFFGDEIVMHIDCETKEYWEICFKQCYHVEYTTDADWRGDVEVKQMKDAQLGYYGQDIEVMKSSVPGFYKVKMDLAIMDVVVECKDITVKKLRNVKAE